MALTKSNVKVTNISELATTPNATDGLTDATFKALFDKSDLDNKNYINNTLTVEIEALVEAVKLAINPIGSIVMNISGTNPSTYIGGTWVAWGTGRVPVGVDTGDSNFNTVEKTGGASTHALTEAELASHTHAIGNYNASGGTIGLSATATGTKGYTSNMSTIATGSGTAHNNLQPYITCYYFKRTV